MFILKIFVAHQELAAIHLNELQHDMIPPASAQPITTTVEIVDEVSKNPEEELQAKKKVDNMKPCINLIREFESMQEQWLSSYEECYISLP